jgi:hypothetical protein
MQRPHFHSGEQATQHQHSAFAESRRMWRTGGRVRSWLGCGRRAYLGRVLVLRMRCVEQVWVRKKRWDDWTVEEKILLVLICPARYGGRSSVYNVSKRRSDDALEEERMLYIRNTKPSTSRSLVSDKRRATQVQARPPQYCIYIHLLMLWIELSRQPEPLALAGDLDLGNASLPHLEFYLKFESALRITSR